LSAILTRTPKYSKTTFSSWWRKREAHQCFNVEISLNNTTLENILMVAKSLVINSLALVMIMGVPIIGSQVSFAPVDHTLDAARKAPVEISGDNVYVTWWSNRTGNDEVMFRASTDAGKTFANKINLSNTTNTDSTDAEIAADGVKVIVTWWERNQTSSEPVMIISTDAGKTFGPLLKLATNGTIGTGEVKPVI
jgi:hypothetical protein